MKFSELLQQPVADDFEVTGLSDDSRRLRPGDIFICDSRVAGDRATDFIDSALSNGARSAVSDISHPGAIKTAAPALATARWARHIHPGQPETLVAVTGTNGKTSVAWFYRQLAEAAHKKAAAIGTLGVYVGSKKERDTGFTSPTALLFHEILDNLAHQGVTHACLEASSHALALNRLDAAQLAAGAITNISRDHTDFHGSMEAYATAKFRLFTELLPEDATAVIHTGRPETLPAAAVARKRGLKVLTVGAHGAELVVRPQNADATGQTVEILYEHHQHTCRLPLVGSFQAQNVAVALGLAVASGLAWGALMEALPTLAPVPGRMEALTPPGKTGPVVVVDYAHTPDALKNALIALRPQTKGRLWAIFGCGGDRDRKKRPEMGKIAHELANNTIITDDNPRSEDPATIRAQILAACPQALDMGDRHAAIAYAVAHATPEDTILLAGKGHETGQIVGKKTLPFDDREATLAALKEIAP